MIELTEQHLELMKHTIGMDFGAKRPKNFKKEGYYRNRYIAGPKHNKYPLLEELVNEGYMEKEPFNDKSDLFYLSNDGLHFADRKF